MGQARANPNYYMTDQINIDTVKCDVEYTPENATEAISVCLGGTRDTPDDIQCGRGQHGFMCGNCRTGWTRTKHPDACISCEEDQPTFGVGIMQQVAGMTGKAIFNLIISAMSLQKAAQ